MKVDANVILARCYNKELYGMRVQRFENDWFRTWAFPIKESTAQDEGFDNVHISGSLMRTDEYPGCPYCEGSGFVHCGVCKKISCHRGESTIVCPWCGSTLEVSEADSFDVTGGGY